MSLNVVVFWVILDGLVVFWVILDDILDGLVVFLVSITLDAISVILDGLDSILDEHLQCCLFYMVYPFFTCLFYPT